MLLLQEYSHNVILFAKSFFHQTMHDYGLWGVKFVGKVMQACLTSVLRQDWYYKAVRFVKMLHYVKRSTTLFNWLVNFL